MSYPLWKVREGGNARHLAIMGGTALRVNRRDRRASSPACLGNMFSRSGYCPPKFVILAALMFDYNDISSPLDRET